MPKLSKRRKAIMENIEPGKVYPIKEAIALLKKCATVKFTESVDVSINLGIDPRKSEQAVRGSVVLPHGIGKKVRVAVFAQGEQAETAKEAGADKIGFDDLAEDIKAGNLNFDVVIATPDAMRIVGQLGQILGPKGLMPNPKIGTVSDDVANAVRNAKTGQVRYRVDKSAIIHCTIGKINFTAENLKENLEALIADINKAKPPGAKGVYLKRVTLSTTMGPGLMVDLATLSS
ncbi:MAG: 50S ribosomal protein L1 [Coxiella sp. DG_40]|nr:MAG: 50S ribosomal protein L1 [Coxiella sp. DG_40]